jgi:hypothetical protein
MSRKCVCCFLLFAVAIALGAAAPAVAESVAVGNPSFESPSVAAGGYELFTNAVTPDVWVDMASGSGVFNNAGGPFGNEITNQHELQLAFMNCVTDENIFQDMTAVYEVGKSYELTIGLAARSDAPAGADDAMELRMFTRTPEFAVLGTTPVRYGDLSNTALTDYTVTIPTVQSTDAWANQPIGIWLYVTSGTGGAWTLDNVRLTATAVPEPASLTLFATAFVGLLAYAWRRR